MNLIIVLTLLFACAFAEERLVFSDDFNEFDLSKWKHELTLGGGGNWEFQWYQNNRSISFARNSVLYLKPLLTSDQIGEASVRGGYTADIWGGEPASLCTGNAFYGCSRSAGGGGNVLNPIRSARLRTAETASIKYGRVEVHAKLPKGDWIWPAIWLLPKDNQYGEWPASGEIDIMESRGNTNYPLGGVEAFGSTLHWGPHWPLNGYEKTHKEYKLPSGTFNDAFHTFGLYWDPTGMFTYLDSPSNRILDVNFTQTSFFQRGGWDKAPIDNPWVNRGNAAPFDREFFLILNVAVGGVNGYFPDGVGGKPWSNTDEHAVNAFWNAKGQWYPTWQGDSSAMQIDWVKMWQRV